MHGQAKSISLWASLPLSQEKAKARESRAGREWENQLPSPCLPAPTASASYKLAEQLWGDIAHSWSSFFCRVYWGLAALVFKHGNRCVKFWGHSTLSREGVGHKNALVVCWDLSHGSLVWQRTYNYGYPHSRTTVCHCGYQEASLGSKAFSSTTKIPLLSGKSLRSLYFFLTVMSTAL